jgi:Flp pilus assembly protein TadG
MRIRQVRSPADAPTRRRSVRDAAGQVIVIFAFSLGLLFGIVALVIDIGSIWNNSLHVQQAAEAAALAGVPYMPGDFTNASAQARAVASKNGFSVASGATVTPAADIADNRRLDVTITQTYGTFFLRTFGLDTVTISRTATGEYTLPVPMGSPLNAFGDNSGGFWTVVAAQGSDRGNGDAFGAYYNPKPTLNGGYDPNGYVYGIQVPVGAGATTVELYDATFCAVDPNKGTGDRWLPWNQTGWPSMSTYYTLWSDPADTPLDYTDDVMVTTTGTLFEHERQSDRSATYRETSASYPGSSFFSLPDCTTTTYHNRWWTLATVTSPGFYRLQVTTTDAVNPDDQKGTSASNKFGIRAVSTDPVYKARVYGLGKVAIYANLTNGVTRFYLARIEAVHAGKTMVVALFDPGDASGTASIQVLKPTATGYTPATFSYTADANATGSRSGTNVTSLTTVSSGVSRYNNSWVTLTIPLPKTYDAPLPPGEPAGTQGGWWKIAYNFNSTATDSTTWQVSIRGNPVHLVLP